jgi:tetratricopeptide (TPR) repeat protein
LKRRPNHPKSGHPQPPAGKSGSSPAPVLSACHKWLFRLGALLIVPALLLGGLEAALRLAGYGYQTGLFKRIPIGHEEFLVNNDTFGFRFFPPEMARFLGLIRMEAQKPPGTYRIFILGESAAMGDPEPAYGASRYLEALLNERFPDTRFEVINTGITAINSHVILPIARDCARCEGDLWIIYMGNNEMVGPFGAATVFGRKAPPLGFVRLNLAIQKTRLGQLLVDIGRKLKGKNSSASWGGMEMFVGNRVPPNDPRKEVVYQNFQQNLHDIVRAGLNSGATILLNTVAVNLKDCPPFASLVNSNLPAADRAQFDKLYKEGCQAEGQSNFTAAAEKFEQAARLDPQCPELQFRWGQCLLALTNLAAARERFQTACDLDALPFRADSRINRTIQEAGRKTADDKLVLVDAAAVLGSNTPAGICGQETFYEHVHFDFDGSYRLGLAWANQIEHLLPAGISRSANTNGWASQKFCELRLGLSDWNRSLVIQHMIGRMQQPPLSSQFDNARRLSVLQERVNQLRPRMDGGAAAKTKEDFLRTLERAPDDYWLRENFALFLQSIGDLPGAAAEWRRIHDLLPHDYLAYFQLGRLLGAQAQRTEAEASLRQAVTMHPSLTEGWIELGNVLALQEKFEPALASYSRARQQRPQDPQTAFRMGKVLARLNRHAEAVQLYRVATSLNPSYWEAHYELGGELDSASQLDEAGSEFAEAVRLNPGHARAHFNYGVLLAKRKRFDEARREFEETIRLEPGYLKAQEYLAQLQAMKRRTP